MLRISLFLTALALSAAADELLRFNAIEPREPGLLEVARGKGGPTLLALRHTGSHARPYIHPLRSPDGKAILTEFAPGHHLHQTGLYWGPTRINGRDYFHHYGADYWRPKPTLYHDKIASDQPRADFGSATVLLDGNNKPLLEDQQHWTLQDYGLYYTLDFAWRGLAETDVTIGKFDYGGLFLRMPWKPGVPAEAINSEGQKNRDGEGQPAKWVDLAMQVEGMDQMAHLAIIDHPKNAGYPTLWRIDDQFGIGPAIARRGDIAIPAGKDLRLRYRVVVYSGSLDRKLITKEEKKFASSESPLAHIKAPGAIDRALPQP